MSHVILAEDKVRGEADNWISLGMDGLGCGNGEGMDDIVETSLMKETR
jgi:hypothetical protein